MKGWQTRYEIGIGKIGISCFFFLKITSLIGMILLFISAKLSYLIRLKSVGGRRVIAIALPAQTLTSESLKISKSTLPSTPVKPKQPLEIMGEIIRIQVMEQNICPKMIRRRGICEVNDQEERYSYAPLLFLNKFLHFSPGSGSYRLRLFKYCRISVVSTLICIENFKLYLCP